LFITETLPDSIVTIQQTDSINIIDTDTTISGNTPIADEITAQANVDNITIIKTPPIAITIRD